LKRAAETDWRPVADHLERPEDPELDRQARFKRTSSDLLDRAT
jgi:hypothetical protein